MQSYESGSKDGILACGAAGDHWDAGGECGLPEAVYVGFVEKTLGNICAASDVRGSAGGKTEADDRGISGCSAGADDRLSDHGRRHMGTMELSLFMCPPGNILLACGISVALVDASERKTTYSGDDWYSNNDFMSWSGGRNLYKSSFLAFSIQKINGVGKSVCFYNRQRI